MKEGTLTHPTFKRRRRATGCSDEMLTKSTRHSISNTLLVLIAASSLSHTSALSSLSKPNEFGTTSSKGKVELPQPSRWPPKKTTPKKEDEIPNLFEELKEFKPEPKPIKDATVKLPLPPLRIEEAPRKTRRMKDALSLSNSKAKEDESPSVQVPLPKLSQKEQARINDMTLGAIVSVGVLYILATDVSSNLKFADSVSTAATNIAESLVPTTTYDILAVALGETFAGLTGAIASLGFNLVMMNTRKFLMEQAVLNEALAESDYFLARAAVLPLLEGAGLSPGIATVASSLFATLPYELVKLGQRQQMARKQENQMLQKLLRQQLEEEEQARRNAQQVRWNPSNWWGSKDRNSNSKSRTVVDPNALQPINSEENVIDSVELFADTCKWLSYSVLMKDFSGSLAWREQPLGNGVESGFYGMLATLTSQIYADFLYVTAEAGPESKRDQVKAREASEWVQLYLSKSISAFTLFGVYASVQIPVQVSINALLSGSIDSCIGSVDVDMCMETYYTQNPPGADLGAQVRSIATALYSLGQMPSVDYLYQPSYDAQLRAIITTLVSLSHRLM